VDDIVGRRTPPTDPEEIRRVIRFRDPFNHPTVVYRRSAVQAAGGYADMALMEDYLLFARMVEAGARPANLAEPLVCYRVGAGAYARRGGRQLLRSELAVQRRFRQLGITAGSPTVPSSRTEAPAGRCDQPDAPVADVRGEVGPADRLTAASPTRSVC
jgi:hypothetical protein